MKPRMSLVTLGVTNLERSVIFYRDGLGLYGRDELAGDAGYFADPAD